MFNGKARILPIVLGVLILIGGASVAHADHATNEREGSTGVRPRITLAPGRSSDMWRATYLLQRPAARLRFDRPASFYREQVWRIVTPGWSLQREGDSQFLVAEPGAESQQLVVEFPVHTKHIPKEYELFASFTDGSVAIYTGHLYVTPASVMPEGAEPAGTEADSMGEDARPVRRVELVPPQGVRGVVRGKVFTSARVWEDSDAGGTYVYFGSIAPIETADMIGIVDPGAPRWLVNRMNEALPQMFDMYTRKFGEALPWKPVVLFSFDDADLAGMDSGGGTLTGLVQMSARGRGWYDETPSSSEQAMYLIAHEAAHFWNGQLHSYEDTADSWMHEGSSDAIASLVLHQQGFIDARRLVERRTRALNECALGLVGGSLSTSSRRGQFRNYYTCGEIVAVWSTAALPGEDAPDRLFDVWRAVFERSVADDGRYDRETYFEALASLGAEAAPIEALRDFVDDEHADPATALIDFMARAGVVIERRDRPARTERQGWASAALQHLMAASCNGRFSYRTEPTGFRTLPVDGCASFAREMVVIDIEGHAVVTDGDLGFRAAAERCAEGGAVTLGLEDGTTVRVPCASALPARPSPLAFSR